MVLLNDKLFLVIFDGGFYLCRFLESLKGFSFRFGVLGNLSFWALSRIKRAVSFGVYNYPDNYRDDNHPENIFCLDLEKPYLLELRRWFMC